MAHHDTVFAQLLKLVPRHEFETLAKRHHAGQRLRRSSRWSQFVALSLAQWSGRCSLRDIVSNMAAQSAKLYHLGTRGMARSTLARVNEKQPYELYQALFYKLLSRCRTVAPRHRFRFKNKLYSIDSTTIDLCLAVFPWARFRTAKGAIKLHIGLDHDGLLPSFVTVTDGKVHDMTVGRTLDLPAGSLVVADRAYTDYAWFNTLNQKGVFFVLRQKRNASYRVLKRAAVPAGQGLSCDQTIRLSGTKAEDCPIPLRRIAYRDVETGQRYVFITNNFHLAARTIADVYKARWLVELFFKCIKQNLKIKSFVGTSKNAVLTQVWIAMCTYLMLAWIKYSSRIQLSIQQVLRLFHLNLFERRDLLQLLRGDPPKPPDGPIQARLAFS